ncbi:serine/threonine-protein phosphatase 6 regulatory ankyrin repeat subunit A-like isoform X2 [Haliotis rufescens]|uniref:serine/threonine-protein phosphatase 6 regulatory ankyrin repeat subunit A-like isoform X2 n=1 Tax=Haliotis rufescens TaxID=6454 RepID=UPI00201F548D|nr:serine/threonine-protein phosphatase 6 regulatory ankyrin repeat subunit A-like isoform X2 [Haliotis rufescens]XP_048251608.1 serine/threonine-protein phosphatase 6 regulatory ankyrin repeat subunit A-like isoform X2 [Haliotis rufescens]XP_048251610.1 serine/threonine-protein phosphatase 6 regulatory ankyrin repeat subunit A-like isoform X2 [Haliotis rufescens]
MSSNESEDSDLSSTYSSDGEVQHSITRPQRTPGLKYLDFDDVDFSYAVFDTPGSIADCIHPIDVKLFVRPDILTSVRSIPDLNFVYINSPTLTFLEPEEEVPAPHSVICDAYIFKTDGVVLVLTFVSRDEPDAVLYNSTQARALTVAVRSRTCTNFHPVHGVVSPDIYKSSRNFLTRIQQLHTTAAHVSVHQSLTSRDGKMVDIFRTMTQHQRPSRKLTDWERLFVKTAAYQEVRDKLQQHNLVMLTGGPGEGKTTIGHMLCCDYQQQGYNTVFCSRWEHFNRDVFQATKPTLVVIDDMADHWVYSNFVKEIHNKTYTNKLVCVLIIYANCKRDTFNRKTDITQIGRQNLDRTKQEYSQMLEMQTDIPSDTREEIIANLPSYVGFPKVIKHFSQDRPTTDPVSFFAYPHSQFRKEIETLLRNVDYSATMIYILVSGNLVADYYPYPYIYNSDESDERDQSGYYIDGSREFQSLFPELRTDDLPDMLHRLCATYLCQSGDDISFTEPVIYDACMFVVDSMFPGVLWKHCKVLYETDNKQYLTDLPDKTIVISSHNTNMFLTQLVEDTRRGKFRHTFRHPVLSREDNIDRFLTQLGDSFVNVLYLQDTAGSSTGLRCFLYWVLQSGNDYLCQKVLQKQELSQVHVSEELACCIKLQDTKSFLYLRQQLLDLQRGDITYTPNDTDANGNSLLMMAVDRNNANMVDILLKDDAECLIMNKVGNSALHLACLRGYTDVVKLLLPHVEVWKNLPGQDLRTPVMMAALKGHGQLYEYLADEGKCDLTGVDDNGDTILHLACQGGSVRVVKHLMSSKLFDINHRGQYGKTPLMIAACRGHRDVFQLLLSQNCHISPEDFSMSETLSYGHVGDCLNMSQFLRARGHGLNRFMLTHKKHYISKLKSHLEEKGSSMLLVDVSGLSLLHTAAEAGNVELAEFLLSKGKIDINTRDASGRTPVMLAAAAGHRIMFEFLTKKQCKLSIKDTKTRGVLHYASQGGNLGIVQDVVYQDVNETDSYNKTPVSYCVERGHKHIFDTLFNTAGDLLLVDTDKNTLLHLASKGGNQAIVEHLLSSGMFDINAVNRDRRTPLLVAAYSGHTDICQHLIVAGADVHRQDYDGNDVVLVAAQTGNLQLAECVLSVKKRVDFVQDKRGKTAAMWAAERGDADMFTLMSKGCDLSVKDDKQNSILHFACTGGDLDIVESIVAQNKVDFNGINISQETPVMRAALGGHKAVFGLLVSKGCDLTVKTKYDDNILHAACEGGNVQIVEYIVSHNKVDINSTGHDRTPVMSAALKGHKAMFDLLVNKGCDLTVKDEYGDNILYVACEGGNVQIVEYIVSHNIVDINSADDVGRTPVMLAVLKGHKAVFDLLVSKGCDLTVKDTYGDNILHAAWKGGNVEIVKYIVSHNIVDINSADDVGRTPVMLAVLKGHKAVFDLLVRKRCDLTVQDEDGDNILHAACNGGNVEIVEYIVCHNIVDINSAGNMRRTPVMLAELKGHKAVFDLLVSKGCDLTVKDKDGDNILHRACKRGNVEIVEYIVSHNIVDINSTDDVRRTPVMRAALMGHKAVFDLLVSKGCDLTVKDKDGDNILHKACEGGNVEIVEYIVSHNIVDINSAGYERRTPVMLAVLKGQKAVFDLLVSKGCDLTVKDQYVDNILHAACDAGNVQIVEYIVSHNIVDINSTCCAGTSLDIAKNKMNHSLVKFLRQFGAV